MAEQFTPVTMVKNGQGRRVSTWQGYHDALWEGWTVAGEQLPEFNPFDGAQKEYLAAEYEPRTVVAGATRVNVTDGTLANLFPGLCELPTGELVGVFRQAVSHLPSDGGVTPAQYVGKIMLTRSTNQGRTWTTPVQIYSDGVLDSRDPQISRLADGRLVVSFFKHSGAAAQGAFVMFSADNGTTWGAPSQIAYGFTQATACSAPVVEHDGALIIAAYGQNASDPVWYVRVARSTDGGSSWSISDVGASTGKSLLEPNVGTLPNGDLMCLMRYDTGVKTIHRATSSDGGVTWATPTGVFAGTGRPTWLALSDGTILGVFRQDGSDGNRPTIYTTSEDNGRTWAAPALLEEAGFEGGYAAIVETEPGIIACLYAREDVRTSAIVRFGYLGRGATTPLGDLTETMHITLDQIEGRFVPRVRARLWLPPGDFERIDGAADVVRVNSRPAWHFDAAINEQIAATFFLPHWWVTYNVDFYWTNPGTGAGDVMWQFVQAGRTDGGNLGLGDSTPSLVTVTAPGQSFLKVTRVATGVAAVADAMSYMRIYRVGTNAADTLPNDAALLGVLLTRVS